jgi:DNA-binding NarL/FixJ family response regulator
MTSPPIPLRVRAANPSELVVHGLRSMLEPFRSTVVLDESGDIDVVLLDTSGTDDGGLALLATLRSELPSAPVVVYTRLDDERTLMRALRAGARGYVITSRSPQGLVDDLVQVADGQMVVDHDLAVRAAALAARLVDLDRSPAALLGLTSREVEVLGRLVDGATAREIGAELFVSHETIRSHLKRIYRKLGVHDRPSAVLRAQQEGILPVIPQERHPDHAAS